MRIRVAREHDAVAVAETEWATAAVPGMLVGRPHEIPVAAVTAKIAELAPLGCYWIVEDGNQVVGHAFLDPMRMAGNSHVFTLNVVVRPESTGQGIGTALMSRILDWARRRPELRKIELLVRATNTRAISMYRRFGFVDEGRLRERVRTIDGDFLDDIAMAWFSDVGSAAQPAIGPDGSSPRR